MIGLEFQLYQYIFPKPKEQLCIFVFKILINGREPIIQVY